MSRAEVVVDLNAVRHNVALLVDRAAGAESMAVVKADGYGHGAVPIARAALSAGATWLGSCTLAEGLALREAGITAPILSWLDTPDVDLSAAVPAGIDVGVSSVEELGRLSGARVHLKVDTGLNRNGCPPELWPDLVRAAAASDNEVYAVWSHLACADEPGHPAIDLQAKRFTDAYDIAVSAGLNPRRHLANSAATLTRPDLHFDLVRLGIAMYGLNPLPSNENLRPAMTFRAKVASVKRIPAGESVSYGQTWTAPHDTTLALVTAGYADGVPRLLSNRMSVLINDHRHPIRGRVCMDQIVIDCGDTPVSPGDDVTLFGPGTHGEPTATEWAETIGTIDYEIVTGMYRPRVTRRYVGE
ncbi:alanine racemase [Actinokineospora enzanensis]|uniref:alanine racemase n=1 Tax=Actinokineospora enzanensis TaxID=155975 RepID=UPI000363D399|nr:alanine racemase [Actinokineospora enzanensis]